MLFLITSFADSPICWQIWLANLTVYASSSWILEWWSPILSLSLSLSLCRWTCGILIWSLILIRSFIPSPFYLCWSVIAAILLTQLRTAIAPISTWVYIPTTPFPVRVYSEMKRSEQVNYYVREQTIVKPGRVHYHSIFIYFFGWEIIQISRTISVQQYHYFKIVFSYKVKELKRL